MGVESASSRQAGRGYLRYSATLRGTAYHAEQWAVVRWKPGYTAITTPHLVGNDSASVVADTGSGRGREEEWKDLL